MVDIVVRFPDQKTADAFMVGLMDGFGENACSFSWWHQKPGTTGKNQEDFEHLTTAEGEIPAGTLVCFCDHVGFDEEGDEDVNP